VLIGLQGRRIEDRKLPPSNLVFLIDVSGSMGSADKLPLLKDAFHMLIDKLRPEDRISMVVYAGAAGMVLPPTRGDDKASIREALGRLDAGGSTAGGAGLMLAYRAARQSFIEGGNNRVILATDGDFNVGLSGDGELVRFIEEKRRTGVYLSVLGFGTGNLKDAKMEQLANKGNGNYFYIDGIHEARKVLVERMGGTLHAIAKDVKLQVEFNPAAVRSYRLIGYENRVLAAEDFNDDRKDAGELGVGHSVTALYEVVPAAPAHPSRPAVDPLKYGSEDPYHERPSGNTRRWGRESRAADADELLTVKFRYKRPNASESRLLSRVLKNRDKSLREASENLRFASAVAAFGLLLRESRYRGQLSYDQVIDLARGAQGRDASGDRAEFVHLAGTAKLLAETEAYGMPER
jgi:Ca-activated chloride channel family protein